MFHDQYNSNGRVLVILTGQLHHSLCKSRRFPVDDGLEGEIRGLEQLASFPRRCGCRAIEAEKACADYANEGYQIQ
jgi:hypothetical protein